MAPPPASGLGPAAFLPDTAVLARVNDRVIRVLDFRDRYFASYPLDRPAGDSAGRVEFLTSLVKGNEMALIARSIDRPPTFEDRVTMREHTNTVLQNMLFQRAVVDSITITDQEIRDAYRQFGYEQHLRHILFRDRATAERVRLELLKGRIAWRDAVRRYSQARDDWGPDGDLGWLHRADIRRDFPKEVFALEAGAMSEIIPGPHGYELMQSLGRRNIDPPAFAGVRGLLESELRTTKRGAGLDRLYQQARSLVAVTYDSANIVWAASKFSQFSAPAGDTSGLTIDLRREGPPISAADTGRVLARAPDRRLTVGQFLSNYRSVSPALRRRIGSVESFVTMLNGMLLEPELVKLAQARGLDKDSLTVALIEKRREDLLVGRLYQDSVLNRVSVTPEERRRYYEEHKSEFKSVPSVRYARIVRASEREADSLLARLKAGERAEAIIRADSLRGEATGAIMEARENQPGPYRQILFEELKPGEATKLGPDRDGKYLVFQVLAHETSRQMSYQEVQNIVDESVQNLKAETLLDAFLQRHSGSFRIEMHPELVMRVRLSDPTLD